MVARKLMISDVGSAGRPFLGLLLVFFLCFAAPVKVNARIESHSMTLFSEGGSLRAFDTFGFKAGGTADFEVQFSRKTTIGVASLSGNRSLHAYVVGCGPKDILIFESQLEEACMQQISEYTNSTLNENCQVFEIGNEPATKVSLVIPKKKILTWGVVMCGFGLADVSMTYTLMNPGGQHLDTGHEPLPLMFLLFMVVWMILLLLQSGHGYLWHASRITVLHRIMFTVPIFKVVHSATGMYKWNTMSVIGYFPKWVLVMHVAAMTFNQAATFGTLLLLARGWLITRRHLPTSEKQTTMTCFILLVVLNFTYRYYSLSNFSFFALAILYMTILALILSSVARNIRELKMQIMILRQADIDPTATPAHLKSIMYRRYQLILFAFVCTKIFLEMVLLFLRDHPWITYFFSELVDMILCVAVGYVFRLRSNNPFNTEQGEFSWLPFNPAELGAGDGNTTQNLIARMAELGVQITLPLPTIYETEIHEATIPGAHGALANYDNEGCVEIPLGGRMMVVVEHPPIVEDEGELMIENIALAARDGLDSSGESDLEPGTGVSVSEAVEVTTTSNSSTNGIIIERRQEQEGSDVEMMVIHPHGFEDEQRRRGVTWDYHHHRNELPEPPDLPGVSTPSRGDERRGGDDRNV